MNPELLADLPLPQRLALSYAPAGAHEVNLALLALDARLGAVLRGRREPIAAQMRLAWWRERLAQAPASWPLGEPVLEALRAWRDPSALAVLAEGWEVLLAERLTLDVAAEFIDARGRACASLARELGTSEEHAAAGAGRVWAAADLAAHVSDEGEHAMTVAHGRSLPPPGRLPRALRPLAVLAALGQRALRRGGEPLLDGPRATLLALRTGLSGR